MRKEITDVRSDNEEEEEETEEDAKRMLEGERGMKTDKPVVLVNGQPVDGEAKAEGIKERKKDR